MVRSHGEGGGVEMLSQECLCYEWQSLVDLEVLGSNQISPAGGYNKVKGRDLWVAQAKAT